MDVVLKGGEPETRSRVYMNASNASLLRKLARYEGGTIDDIVTKVVRLWIQEHPELEIVEDAEPPLTKSMLRAPRKKR